MPLFGRNKSKSPTLLSPIGWARDRAVVQKLLIALHELVLNYFVES